MTPQQIKLLQIARRAVSSLRPDICDEQWWRTVLFNVGFDKRGREALRRRYADPAVEVSVKDLDNAGFELVMAFLEERGFRDRVPGRSADHWRSRCARLTGLASNQQIHMIHGLYAEYCSICRDRGLEPSALGGFCRQASSGEHDQPSLLTPHIANKLIECLKDVVDRHREEASRA